MAQFKPIPKKVSKGDPIRARDWNARGQLIGELTGSERGGLDIGTGTYQRPQRTRRQVLEGFLAGDLEPSSSGGTTSKTATLNLALGRTDSNWAEQTSRTLTVTNRSDGFLAFEDEYLIVVRINGEWRPADRARTVEGTLDAELSAATDYLTGPSTATLSVHKFNSSGDLEDSTIDITVTNRLTEIDAVASGTFIGARWVNNEWRPIFSDCGASST